MFETNVYDTDGLRITSLAQWDKSVYICIKNTDISETTTEVHFFHKDDVYALVVEGSVASNTVTVKVPDKILQDALPVFGYVYRTESETTRSEYGFKLNVLPRAKPAEYAYGDDDYVSIEKVLADAKVYAESAADSATAAKSSASTASSRASAAATSATKAANSATAAAESATAAAESEAKAIAADKMAIFDMTYSNSNLTPGDGATFEALATAYAAGKICYLRIDGQALISGTKALVPLVAYDDGAALFACTNCSSNGDAGLGVCVISWSSGTAPIMGDVRVTDNWSYIKNRPFATIGPGLTVNGNVLEVNSTAAISSTSTDAEIPTAKAVYDYVQSMLTASSEEAAT